MNHLFTKLLFLFFILSNAACTLFSTTEKEVMAYDGPYFHARPFFEAEIERIEAENFVFQKEVQLNENVEGKTLDSLDIARELSIFIKNDINRPAYDGRYEMDSIFDPQKQLRAIKYTALDDKLPVKNLSLQFEKWGISRIELKTSSSSRLLEANSTAIYEPQTGYQIENYQKITFLGEQNMKISVDYIDRDGRR